VSVSPIIDWKAQLFSFQSSTKPVSTKLVNHYSTSRAPIPSQQKNCDPRFKTATDSSASQHMLTLGLELLQLP